MMNCQDLQVSIVDSVQQETDDLTKQTKFQAKSYEPLRQSKRRWVITTLELEEEDPGPFPKLIGETAPQFTLLIRARDCGEPSLSSTATVHMDVQEGNNHRPAFTQENYKIQIPEGRVSKGVLRLLVRDRDSPFTSAWRAKFNTLHGNEEGHFDISTDPETNEGILNVIKPLDYETRPAQSLVIVVENEERLFFCERGKLQPPRKAAASATVSVQVTDANDPPAFHPRASLSVKRRAPGLGPCWELLMPRIQTAR
ncbi:cadherin-like protein 26 [Hylobates moloch]|uniref:cadherin-like protein 26 n=1 Tax=Hylobates moloch TaxID=81572 RepID=UPI002674C797|nr:cadherin-like protein 26 [Hylobates moloch]